MSLSSCHGCVDGPARPPKHVSHGDVRVATGNGVHSGFTVHRNHACGIKHACDALHASAFIDLSLQLGLTCSTRDANQRRLYPLAHSREMEGVDGDASQGACGRIGPPS